MLVVVTFSFRLEVVPLTFLVKFVVVLAGAFWLLFVQLLISPSNLNESLVG